MARATTLVLTPVALALWGAATTAHAELPAAPPPFTLTSVAPAGCPSTEQLEGMVSTRLGGSRDGGDPAFPAVRLSVKISESAEGFVAALSFVDAEGRDVIRQVVAPDCLQAADGITLVAALALESQLAPVAPAAPPPAAPPEDATMAAPPQAPMAATPPAPTPGIPEMPKASGNSTLTPSARRGLKEPRQRAPIAMHRPADATSLRSSCSPEGECPADSVGILAVAQTGVAPRIAPGLEAVGRLVPAPHWPIVRLAVRGLDSFGLHQAGAKVRFRQLLAGAGMCVPSTFPSRAVRLEPCLGSELGLYAAQGYPDQQRVVRAHRVHRPWAAGVLGLWLRAQVGHAYLELGAEGRAPFLRQPFELTNPTQRIHDVPALTGALAAGAGVQF